MKAAEMVTLVGSVIQSHPNLKENLPRATVIQDCVDKGFGIHKLNLMTEELFCIPVHDLFSNHISILFAEVSFIDQLYFLAFGVNQNTIHISFFS